MKRRFAAIGLSIGLTAWMLTMSAAAATIAAPKTSGSKSSKVTENSATQKKMAHSKHTSKSASKGSSASKKSAKSAKSTKGHKASKTRKKSRYYERFYASSFASDQADGDITAGEDPIVRAAAIEALGNMNGTVVSIDPDSGRILAMVNQKLALSAGAQPCSTIKVAVALAALSENVITKDSEIQLGKHYRMDLTTALAHSNNAYFATVGQKLGFEKVSYYAHQYGLGELAGWHIQGEHLGTFPSTVLDARLGGVGKMCSFGESISLTPLQLGALMAAIANGGTLYYLQHPTSPEDVANFTPKVKRQLDISSAIPEMMDGLSGAVEYGTARHLRNNFIEEPVVGKTGTCSNNGTRFGWFASYANTEHGRIVTVIFLQGGRPTFGPRAAELAGYFYRNLYDHDYFSAKPIVPAVSSVSSAASSMSQ